MIVMCKKKENQTKINPVSINVFFLFFLVKKGFHPAILPNNLDY